MTFLNGRFMGMSRALLFFVFLSCTVYCKGSFTWGPVIGDISTLSTPTGGIEARVGSGPTLEATAAAVYFTKFYNLKGPDKDKIVKFLNSLKRDESYSNSQHEPAKIQSLFNAIATFKRLKYEIKNAEKLKDFIMGLYDESTGLFSPEKGAIPDLKASYFAVKSLLLLDNANYLSPTSELHGRIWGVLTEISDLDPEVTFFKLTDMSDPLNRLEVYVYSMMLAPLVRYNFSNQKNFLNYFTSLRGGDGGFSASRGGSNLHDSYLVSCAYYSVRGYEVRDDAWDALLDRDSFLGFMKGRMGDFLDSYYVHLSLVNFNFFEELFDLEVDYDILTGSIKSNIVQGTQFKPMIQIQEFRNYIRSDLFVGLTIEFGYTRIEYSMQWDPNTNHYVVDKRGEFFDTHDMFGRLTHTFTFKMTDGVEIYHFQCQRSTNVGFDLTIDSHVIHNDRDASDDQIILPDSNMNFLVTISNTTMKNILQGDFDMRFILTDSSGVVLSREVYWAIENANAFEFSYTFDSGAILLGDVTAHFSVSIHDDTFVHSTEKVVYKSNSTLISIIENPEIFDKHFVLGNTYDIIMKPASNISNLGLTFFNLPKNFDSCPKFYLCLYRGSVNDGVLVRIEGVPLTDNGEHLRYVFSWNIRPRLDLIGSYQLQFEYTDSKNRRHPLYFEDVPDSSNDLTTFELEVNHNLVLKDVLGISNNSLMHYGDVIKFHFKVFDEISKLVIESDGQAQESSSLYLQMSCGSNDVLVAPIRAVGDEFWVEWQLDPNVLQGNTKFSISMEGRGLSSHKLLTPSGTPWQLNIVVQGDINFVYKLLSNSAPEVSLGYISLYFSPRYGDHVLNNANLVVKLVNLNNHKTVDCTPATFSLVPSSEFAYSASFVFPIENDVSTKYAIQILRAVDNGSGSLFSLKVRYHGSKSLLPFKSESIILIVLILSFSYFSYNKWLVVNSSHKKKSL